MRGADGKVHIYSFYNDSRTTDWVGDYGLFDLGDVFVGPDWLVGGIIWDELSNSNGGSFKTSYYGCFWVVSTRYAGCFTTTDRLTVKAYLVQEP